MLRLCLALLVAVCVEGGSLHKVWDLDAGTSAGQGEPLGVYALSFSPDGRHILVVAGHSWQDEFVLAIDAGALQPQQKRVEINPKISAHDPAYVRLSWDPSGDRVVVGTFLLDLSDASNCSLPGPGFRFTDLTHLIGTELRQGPRTRPNMPPVGWYVPSFYDLDCQRIGAKESAEGWAILDTAPARGLVSWRKNNAPELIVCTVDELGRETGRHFPMATGGEFADSARAVCGVWGPNAENSAFCFDVDSGRQIAERGGWTYLSIQTALHAPRVVLSNFGKKLDLIDFFWYPGGLKKRLVWDFRTGKDLVSWSPKSQVVHLDDNRRETRQPYRFAISPDGESIAEGGAGVVSLYRIEP